MKHKYKNKFIRKINKILENNTKISIFGYISKFNKMQYTKELMNIVIKELKLTQETQLKVVEEEVIKFLKRRELENILKGKKSGFTFEFQYYDIKPLVRYENTTFEKTYKE